ncbi:MAG: hypothetical protein IJG50_03565 [Clostridia bacterium]|nr:hypothetical protein [Clostridia bacterium]
MFRLHKSIKPLAAALAGALILAALFGCAQSNGKEQREYVSIESPIIRSAAPYKAPASLKDGANKVTVPVTPERIIYTNGLVLNQADVEMDESAQKADGSSSETGALVFSEGRIHYYIASGLLDKEVETKINDTIYDTVLELYNAKLPPYRGIRAVDFSRYTFEKEVYVRECANFSNILSLLVTLNVYGSYEDDDVYDSVFIGDAVPLNFDLRTGEQFPLSDMFADDADYKEIINAQIADYLAKNNMSAGDGPGEGEFYEYDSNLSLVYPFKGISDDMKFSVSEYGIELIFDYNTPEFDTSYYYEAYKSFNPAYFNISYSEPEVSEAIGVFSRFETQDSIYENTRAEEFIVSNYPVKSTDAYYSPNDLGFNDEDYQYTNVNMYASIPCDISDDALSDMINEKYDAADETVRTLAEELFSKYRGSTVMLNVSYSVTRYGKYLLENDSRYVEVYTYDDDYNGNQELFDVHNNQALYDETTGSAVELSDLFKDGVDYKALLVEKIKEEQSQWDNELKDDEYYLEAIEKGQFNLYQEGLTISYERNAEWGDYYSISFEALGRENLTIFD